jgi:putative addiction module component (TIGR02574 family)
MLFAMGDEPIEILKKALHLPPAERAELAGLLIESLVEAEDDPVQVAWDKEIIRRMEGLDTGRVEPISLEETRKKISVADSSS